MGIFGDEGILSTKSMLLTNIPSCLWKTIRQGLIFVSSSEELLLPWPSPLSLFEQRLSKGKSGFLGKLIL